MDSHICVQALRLALDVGGKRQWVLLPSEEILLVSADGNTGVESKSSVCAQPRTRLVDCADTEDEELGQGHLGAGANSHVAKLVSRYGDDAKAHV